MAWISVTVHFTGLIDIKNLTSGSLVSIPEGTTTEGLLSQLGIREEHRRYLIVRIRDTEVPLSRRLDDGDEVRLFLLIGGG